jgi:2-keto-4-pentenoate hydratase/2-oxohepta-3-ene-1,7-dioic acid hydratase in catechol pathway
MKLVTFESKDGRAPGVLTGEMVVSLAGAGFRDMLDVIAAAGRGLQRIAALAANPPAGALHPLAAVKLCAPIPRPPKLICIGLNYSDHARETGMEIPKVPTVFAKFPTTIIGPGDPIVLPKASAKPDYEAEFAFVIGPGGRYIPAGQWRDHVFGYMNLHDVSARDFQLATTQWTMGKNFDTFAPTGPWLVTADEIEDPHKLEVGLTLNGEVMQRSNTSNLIFGIPQLVAFLSSVLTLEPGDIVATGTPAGVGMGRRPPRFLKDGDEVAVSVEGLGVLRNRVIAE